MGWAAYGTAVAVMVAYIAAGLLLRLGTPLAAADGATLLSLAARLTLPAVLLHTLPPLRAPPTLTPPHAPLYAASRCLFVALRAGGPGSTTAG